MKSYELKPLVQEMLFEVFLIYSSGGPFVQRNHLCNLVQGIMNIISVKLFLKLDQWIKRRCHLKEKFLHRWTHDGPRPITLAHIELKT